MLDSRNALGLGLATALLGAIVWVGMGSAGSGGDSALTLEERYLVDQRIDRLVYDSPFKRPFDGQVAFMVPVWVSKLEHGTKEPLRQAKREIGEAGGAAIPELQALWDEITGSADGKWRNGVLENILQACANIKTPEVLTLVRGAMSHWSGSVRLAALPSISRHGDPSDYDAVAIWLPVLGSGEIKSEYAEVLKELDRQRFFEDVLAWFSVGQHPDLWPFLALDVAECRDPDLAAAFKEAAPLREDKYVPFLMAPAAASGDQDALQELMTRVSHERPGTRQYAVQALASIGRTDAVAPLVLDEHAGVRRLVVQALIGDPSPASTEYLREATRDEDRAVRIPAVKELVLRGHEVTVSEVLAQLEGHLGERSAAIDALRLGWSANPGSAERAFDRLISVWKREEGNPSARISVLDCLSHVPLVEAATFLLDFGRQFPGNIRGRAAHREACGLVWNTGEVGRSLLREALVEERDPLRRLDLLEYIWQDHSDAGRQALLGVLLDDSANPFERLYAADRLILIGPAEVVAPALKRVYTQCTHRVVRPAMQALLWTWYGQHDFR